MDNRDRVWDLRGRPLMIWGGARRKNRKWIYFFRRNAFWQLFFPGEGLLRFFPGEGLVRFISSWRRASEIIFFLDFLRLHEIDFVFPVKGWLGFCLILEKKQNSRKCVILWLSWDFFLGSSWNPQGGRTFPLTCPFFFKKGNFYWKLY